jgi:2-polyprenyl-6-methoxyphenol hydroxylase-like FAD-dependent oxidoreductase
MWMTFGRRAFFGHFVAPDGTVYWFSNVASEVAPKDGAGDWKAILLEQHRGDPFPVELILEATEGGIGGWPIFDIPSLPRWHAGKVCLLGDSAHAISPSAGQGASLALEDALVLARSLRDAAPEDAFARYQAERRPRVERLVAASRRIGDAKISTSPIANWFRDRLLGFFVRMNARSSAWWYAYDVEWP